MDFGNYFAGSWPGALLGAIHLGGTAVSQIIKAWTDHARVVTSADMEWAIVAFTATEQSCPRKPTLFDRAHAHANCLWLNRSPYAKSADPGAAHCSPLESNGLGGLAPSQQLVPLHQ